MASSEQQQTSSATLQEVVVRPKAFCSMILHARQHKHDVIHGFLLGSSSATQITVDEAVPVCHCTPTLPLIETAMALIEVQKQQSSNGKSSIVGWYTAPVLLGDSKPGPVAMRVTSNLEAAATTGKDDKAACSSTLLVLNNTVLGACVKGEGSKANDAVQAYGKDFGKQFQEKVQTVVEEGDGACQSLQQAVRDGSGITCLDLQDNMAEPSSIWYPNAPLNKLVDAEMY